MIKHLFATISGLAAVLLFAGVSFASTSVRLEQPKSPTNQNNFNLVFVALNTDNSPITVKCFKEAPGEASFSQFGSDITLSDGGNTDNCPVDSSVVSTNGTYAFYVTANGTPSSTVTVDYNTSGPGTPSNYSKDHPTSCQYKISFRTADDGGKTSKVELYRSVNTSFNADSGTRVQSMGIGSNTDSSFTDNVPDCNQTYYYAIRAFDSAGNGSGLVGDSETQTTVINPTGTPSNGSGSTSNTSANSSAGSSQTSGGAIPVVTSGVTPGEPTSTEPSAAPTAEEKGVLGAKTSPMDNLVKYGGWGIIIVGLLAVVYFLIRRMRTA